MVLKDIVAWYGNDWGDHHLASLLGLLLLFDPRKDTERLKDTRKVHQTYFSLLITTSSVIEFSGEFPQQIEIVDRRRCRSVPLAAGTDRRLGRVLHRRRRPSRPVARAAPERSRQRRLVARLPPAWPAQSHDDYAASLQGHSQETVRIATVSSLITRWRLVHPPVARWQSNDLLISKLAFN